MQGIGVLTNIISTNNRKGSFNNISVAFFDSIHLIMSAIL